MIGNIVLNDLVSHQGSYHLDTCKKPMPDINSTPQAPAISPASRVPEREREPLRRPNKVAETVSAAIVQDIVSRGLKKGDRLPAEAEMLATYQVSRSSLREALRLLEVHGLIIIRPGAGAGTVVGQATAASFARMYSLFLNFSGSTYDEILESWMLTEGVLARLASQNPDRVLVDRLMRPFLVEHEKQDVSEGVGFHDTVASLARNPALALLFKSVALLVNDHILKAHRSRSIAAETIHDHHTIAQAILDGDPKRAEEEMLRHTRRVIDECRLLWPQTLGDLVEWR